jgi:hypothetical protein
MARRIGQRVQAAARPSGGRCHNDPAHVAQVLAVLAEAGALADVLERAGLTLDDIDGDAGDLSPIGALPPPGR